MKVIIVDLLILFIDSFAELIEQTGLTAGDRIPLIPLVSRGTGYSQIKQPTGILGGFFCQSFQGSLPQFGNTIGDMVHVSGFIALAPFGYRREKWTIGFNQQAIAWHQGG